MVENGPSKKAHSVYELQGPNRAETQMANCHRFLHVSRFPQQESTWKARTSKESADVRKNQVQVKHAKSFSIRNFGAPKAPPKFFMFGLFPVFWGKRRPQRKRIEGLGVPWTGGGSGRGVSGEIFYVYPLFQGLKEAAGSHKNPQKKPRGCGFLIAVGASCLQWSFFTYGWQLRLFYLQLELFCLQF